MRLLSITSSSEDRILASCLCIALSCILFAGLVPRGNYSDNWIELNAAKTGVSIGQHGYLINKSHNPFNSVKPGDNIDLTMTIEFYEQIESNFRILFYLGGGGPDEPLIIGQWKNQLIVMQGSDFRNRYKGIRLTQNIQDFLNRQVVLKLMITDSFSKLQIEDQLITLEGDRLFDPQDFHYDYLMIGNSPNGMYGWRGTISKFNLSVAPNLDDLSPGNTSSVSFEVPKLLNTNSLLQKLENSGLTIPGVGWYPQREVLKKESVTSLLATNKLDLIINLIGFIPLGFLVARITQKQSLSGTNLTYVYYSVLAGLCVSLFIELAQVYVVGRKSNLHDLVLNGFGALIGAIVLFFGYKVLQQKKIPQVAD